MKKLSLRTCVVGILCVLLSMNVRAQLTANQVFVRVENSVTATTPAPQCGQIFVPVNLGKSSSAPALSKLLDFNALKIKGKIVQFGTTQNATFSKAISTPTKFVTNKLDGNLVVQTTMINQSLTFSNGGKDFELNVDISAANLFMRLDLSTQFELFKIGVDAAAGEAFSVQITEVALTRVTVQNGSISNGASAAVSNVLNNTSTPLALQSCTNTDFGVVLGTPITASGSQLTETPLNITLPSTGANIDRLETIITVTDLDGNLNLANISFESEAILSSPLLSDVTSSNKKIIRIISPLDNNNISSSLENLGTLKITAPSQPLQGGRVKIEVASFLNGTFGNNNQSICCMPPPNALNEVSVGSAPKLCYPAGTIAPYYFEVTPEQVGTDCRVRCHVQLKATDPNQKLLAVSGVNIRMSANFNGTGIMASATTPAMTVWTSTPGANNPFCPPYLGASVQGSNITFGYCQSATTNAPKKNISTTGNACTGLDLDYVDGTSTMFYVDFVGGNPGDKFNIRFEEAALQFPVNGFCSIPVVFPAEITVRGLSGSISNCCDKPISNVVLRVSEKEDCMEYSETCESTSCIPSISVAGNTFNSCFPTGSHAVTPCKVCDASYLTQETTTFDLVLINKHILGIQPILDPCSRLAADINMSNTITTTDLVNLRKVILKINEFPLNMKGEKQCWRFYEPKTYDALLAAFPGKTVYPPSCGIVPNNDDAVRNINFKAVMLGDINCKKVLASETPIRITTEEHYETDDIVRADVEMEHFDRVEGYQMGIQFDRSKLEFVGIEQGDIAHNWEENAGLTEVEDGKIRLAWIPEQGEAITAEHPRLARLTFRARQTIERMRDVMRLDDRVLENEIYYSEEDQRHLVLDVPPSSSNRISYSAGVSTLASTNNILQVQAQPNPFSDVVSLRIAAPQSEVALVSVYDALGRLLIQQEESLSKGTNFVRLSNTSSWIAGAYQYVVRTSSQSTSGKLLKY